MAFLRAAVVSAIFVATALAGDDELKCAGPMDNCKSSRCCQTVGHQCFLKNEYWASCKADCTPGINPYDPPEYQQPWSCELLSPVIYEGTTVPADFEPPAGSVVAQHGQLSVKGTQLVDSNGDPIRLRGMSLFWSQWGTQFWTSDVVSWLKEDWNVTLIRAPMGVDYGGYLSGKDVQKSLVATVVDAAIRAGIYVIIDWHDHEAEKHTLEAREFFEEFSKMYGHFPNVLFEIFNEPLKESWSDDIKPYEQEIVNLIRNHTDNVIICGTRQWSQDVDVAAEDPLVGDNLVYTIHFYATFHKAALRQKALAAMNKGVALFASEWGTCAADGNGTIDFESTNIWLDFLEQYNISDANWAINDKAEACSAIVHGAAGGEGSWGPDVLTDSGRFVRESLRRPLVYWPAPDVARWEAEGAALAEVKEDEEGDAAAEVAANKLMEDSTALFAPLGARRSRVATNDSNDSAIDSNDALDDEANITASSGGLHVISAAPQQQHPTWAAALLASSAAAAAMLARAA